MKPGAPASGASRTDAPVAGTIDLARAALRHLATHGLPPTPENYRLAWEAVGGSPAEQAGASDSRQADRQQRLNAELVEIVRALCDNIEVVADDGGWLSAQAGAIREAVGRGTDRQSLAAARALLLQARSSQEALGHSRREALGSLRALLPDLIGQVSQLGARSGEFSQAMSTHLDSIAQADSIEAIAHELRALIADSQSMTGTVAAARDRLEGTAQEARRLESEVARLEAELARTHEQLLTDHLTQAANRAGLEQAFGAAKADIDQGVDLALALLDIDDFKKINDAMGHFAGDGALVHLSALLRRQVRAQDTVARYGGEEFVIVLPGLALADAQALLVRLQRELTREVFLYQDRGIFITFSAGVTRVSLEDTLEAALARADDAMYQAKRAGKNCVMTA